MKVTLHARPDKYAEGGFGFYIFGHDDMTSQGYVACDTVEVEFNEPSREVLVNGAVAAYRAEQQRIRAEMTAKVQMIDEAIQSLLCIEQKEDAPA